MLYAAIKNEEKLLNKQGEQNQDVQDTKENKCKQFRGKMSELTKSNGIKIPANVLEGINKNKNKSTKERD